MDTKPSSPEDIKKKVLDTELYEAIKELARDCDPSNQSIVCDRAREILKEIGYSKSLRTIKWLALLIVKILNKLMNGIYVNESELLKLKESMGNCPLVFVPTHRSYGDFILMAFVCFMYEIEIPCVAAGLDFLSMWVIGEVIRNTKAFYIRRSFRSDKLYKLLFEQYVTKLLSFGDSPLEFFIEGTRSRNGKSLKPKYGFLSMVLKPFLSGEVPDVKLVPVAISYDRFLEEWLFIREQQGIPKPKESTSGLLKAKSILKENYGNAYFHFGQPISVHEWIRRQSDIALPKPVLHDITELASLIIKTHIQLQVIGTSHLVMICLYNNLVTNNKTSMSLKSVADRVRMLQNVLKSFGATVLQLQDDIEREILQVSCVNARLVCAKNGTLQLDDQSVGCGESNSSITNDGKLEIIDHDRAIGLLLYVNPVAAVLFSPSLLLLVILSGSKMSGNCDTDIEKTFKDLSYLFEDEFPAALYELENSYQTSKEFLLQHHCIYSINEAKDGYVLSTNLALVDCLYSLIYPYILGYLLMAQRLLQINDASTSQQLLNECKITLRTFMDHNRRMFPMFLTNPFVSSCISTFIKTEHLYRTSDKKFLVNPRKIASMISQLSALNIPMNESRMSSKL
ncbi:glycerol-3-phosphate acyltransferase [Nesidiocoris tenuis]|uniref:Glycerol-3-phosphate acyltransferase n=1 Tax=Nesidiocoris tenuis TaxID=355587 RepID=A0ABN7AHL3_9HEMI|nr:glycerol-3-phosphate acyltransferase [Nesidiocoris tenuis]